MLNATFRKTTNGILLLLLASASLAIPGCGDGRPVRVPVSGKVLIDGQPVTKGSIQFHEDDGRPARGSIGSDGSFTLTTFDEGDGCTPGNHRVSVISCDEPPGMRRWFIPKRYSKPEESGIVTSIDGPTDSIRIDLTWNGKMGPEIEKMSGVPYGPGDE
jgi:hypothetical protein